jgi:ArsR family transcriptional regulator
MIGEEHMQKTTATSVLEHSAHTPLKGTKQNQVRSTKFAPPLSDEEAQEQGRLLKVLGDHTRLQLLTILHQHGGDVSVYDLVEMFPLEQPTISHHLRLLRDARLVEYRKQGLWTYYYIRPDAWQDRVQPALQTMTTVFRTASSPSESTGV